MKRWKAAASAVAAVLLCASCATGYGPNMLTGGYHDERLDDSHYRVKFDGNGYASEERVWNFWMYRCAELTLQKGYTYFALQQPGDPLSQAAPPRAGRRFAAYRPGQGDAPRLVRTGYIYVPVHVPPVTTWHTDAVVAMYNDPLPDYRVVLQAQTVLDELAPYVKSDGKTTPIARDELFRHASRGGRADPEYGFGGTL